jgi:hypothetical protein
LVDEDFSPQDSLSDPFLEGRDLRIMGSQRCRFRAGANHYQLGEVHLARRARGARRAPLRPGAFRFVWRLRVVGIGEV